MKQLMQSYFNNILTLYFVLDTQKLEVESGCVTRKYSCFNRLPMLLRGIKLPSLTIKILNGCLITIHLNCTVMLLQQ